MRRRKGSVVFSSEDVYHKAHKCSKVTPTGELLLPIGRAMMLHSPKSLARACFKTGLFGKFALHEYISVMASAWKERRPKE